MITATENTTRNAYELANAGEAYCPDGEGSAGAQWLVFLQTMADERWAYWADEGELPDSVDDDRVNDCIHELADAHVPIYTGERWVIFTELGAYREDLAELGYETVTDMTEAAGVALYIVAERVLRFLFEDWIDDRNLAEA